MITVNFDNKIIENYIKEECNDNISSFIKQITEFIELQKIKRELSISHKELEKYKNGNLKLNSLEDLLSEN